LYKSLGTARCTAQVSAYEASRTAAANAKTAADQAKRQKQVDKTQGDVSIQNARQSLITAQNNLELAGTDKPANVAAQRDEVPPLFRRPRYLGWTGWGWMIMGAGSCWCRLWWAASYS
jgi:hypothetical protein